jgi:hypothetical protein
MILKAPSYADTTSIHPLVQSNHNDDY